MANASNLEISIKFMNLGSGRILYVPTQLDESINFLSGHVLLGSDDLPSIKCCLGVRAKFVERVPGSLSAIFDDKLFAPAVEPLPQLAPQPEST